ncbi:MAG TPA: hypothetical protein VMH86_06020 [Rhizomicrobium sp.]|nr:hypothetical protein [Rhizomicrobium sp.]
MKAAVLVCVGAVLAGCTTVVSDRPVFPASMAAGGPSLEGAYLVYGENGENVITVSRRDGGRYEAIGFGTRPHYREGLAMEFAAVPLGGGDFALQVSCLASRNDSGAWNKEKDAAFAYWTLSASRARGDWFAGIIVADADRDALAAKYRLAAGKNALKIDGLSPGRALSFFRDWQAAQLAVGGDRVIPVIRALDWTAPTGEAEFDHPIACRDVKAE